MPSKLHIFDFDGTLFNSPSSTPDNHKKYEKATGLPWLIDKEMSRQLSKKHGKFVGIRKGWWGRPETLEPPLVADPAPQEWFFKKPCDDFRESKANPEALTVILTGRHAGIKNHVLRILRDGKLVQVEEKKAKDGKRFFDLIDADVQMYCLGDNGPTPKGSKPSETFPWKVWVIQQFLEIYPEVDEVGIWEDREEHIAKFKELELGKTVVVTAAP